jgi:pimeloyl-ACP methyl ester carboxylesterase
MRAQQLASEDGAGGAGDAAVSSLPEASGRIRNGQRDHASLHSRGYKPAVILIHGFPQDRLEYRPIISTLAKQFTVVAVDLRRIGGSTPASDGYNAANMPEVICQLPSVLKLKHDCIVGHDIGGHVAYACVRRFPQMTRGAMVLEMPIPGIEGWEEAQGAPFMCNMHLMQVSGLAEKLVDGRQAAYLGYLFQFGKFTPEEIAHYRKAVQSGTAALGNVPV